MAEVPDEPTFEPIELAAGVAPLSELSVLHGTLAKAMVTRIKTGAATAAEWNAAAKFLADNNVSSKLGESEATKKLAEILKQKQSRNRGAIPTDALRAAEAAADRTLGE